MALNPFSASEKELLEFCSKSDSITAEGYKERVLRLSEHAVIKFGLDVTQEEAATQEYAWRHLKNTPVRVPQVYRFFCDTSLGPSMTIGYLVMEYIKGISLDNYLSSATPNEESAIVNRIIDAISHLSEIPVPATQAPGPLGIGEPRGYLWSDCGTGISFQSIAAMENWLNRRIAIYRRNTDAKFIFSPQLCMCHTDLAPRNIIVLESGGLALLDWAFAGFYPPIFERYALVTRCGREPIFYKILQRTGPLAEGEEKQLALLSQVETIQLKFGSSLRYNEQQERSCDMPKTQASLPPPLPPFFKESNVYSL